MEGALVHLYHYPKTSRFYPKRVELFVRNALPMFRLEWTTSLDGTTADYLIVGSVPHPGEGVDLETLLPQLEANPLPHDQILLVGQTESNEEKGLLEEALEQERVGTHIQFHPGGAVIRSCPCLRERLENVSRGGVLVNSVEKARTFIRSMAEAASRR